MSGAGRAPVPASRYLVFLAIATAGCASDLLTKHWMFQWYGMPRERRLGWIWEGFVGIQTATNDGALFGMGHGWGPFFAVLSVLAGAGIVLWLFRYGAAHDLLLTVALGCVMAGIAGNLYDRLGFWQDPDLPGVWRSEVRDWILFCYRDYRWPNFNLADSLLVCGAGLLMWHGFGRQQPQS